MHANRFSGEVNYDYVSISLPYKVKNTLGISVIRLGIDRIPDTRNALLDVLVGESGFGLTTCIFAIVNSLIWIVLGFGLGYAATQELGFGIIFAFIFLFLGFLPYNVVTMPMKVAFRTFLYSFAKDTVEGYKKPSRLPAELQTEFKTLAARDVKRRGMRDPSEYF